MRTFTVNATWAKLVAVYRLTLVAPETLPAHANWSGLLAVPKFFDGEQVDRCWRPRSPLGNLNNLERDDFRGRIGLCTHPQCPTDIGIGQ